MTLARGASIVCGLLLLTAQSVAAQSSVTGIVRDSAGRPIASAEVVIEALSKRAIADPNGRYILTDVPAGLRLIRARMLGYVKPGEHLFIVKGIEAWKKTHTIGGDGG